MIRSSSHNAEHNNIRKKVRKPVDGIKHLTHFADTSGQAKRLAILEVFGSKRSRKDKSCCQMTVLLPTNDFSLSTMSRACNK